MATFTLNTRQGPQEFTVNGDSGYVRLNGKQICDGGYITGSTLECREVDLEKVARKWWSASLRLQRAGR
jgi:hypothetical protein